MNFQIKAKIEKELWSNDQSTMYKISEADSDKAKQWTVFTTEKLTLGSVYELAGRISESKDKKVKDANGRDIWRATFNAETCKSVEESQDFSLETIPF